MNTRENRYRRAVLSGLLLCSLFSVAGCFENKPEEADERSSKKETIFTPPPGEKIKFKFSNGSTAFSLKPKGDGMKVVDADDKEIVRVTLSGPRKYKFKDANDQVLGYVTGGFPSFKIKDSNLQDTLFEFQRQPDGDWKLKDGKEGLLAKVGARDYGWKVEDGSEKQLAKIKIDGERTSIRDGSEKTIYYTNDLIPSIAAVPFGLPSLGKQQAAALSAVLTTAK